MKFGGIVPQYTLIDKSLSFDLMSCFQDDSMTSFHVEKCCYLMITHIIRLTHMLALWFTVPDP